VGMASLHVSNHTAVDLMTVSNADLFIVIEKEK
jgi:hypothetical protein